ncbi:Uncharacterised protein [Enterobacter cloacae]|nr:Uncharacterised protein [Enterobacter cloacae]
MVTISGVFLDPDGAAVAGAVISHWANLFCSGDRLISPRLL